MVLDIIYNPLAGGEKNMQKALAEVEKYLTEKGVLYNLHKSEYKKHAIKLTEDAIKKGAKNIIAMGGDGTVNEVLNGITDFENVTMGIIPSGTGNDFASHINLPKSIPQALDIILKNEPKKTDFMQLPTVRAINIVGMGIDVLVLKYYLELKKKTKAGYYKCFVKALKNYECKKMKITADEEISEGEVFLTCVANGTTFGGGIKICPNANCEDGKLNVLRVAKITGLKVLGSLMKVKKGKVLKLKETKETLTKNVSIEGEENLIQVDGELYENIPFNVQIVSDKLKMFR